MFIIDRNVTTSLHMISISVIDNILKGKGKGRGRIVKKIYVCINYWYRSIYFLYINALRSCTNFNHALF